MLRERIASATPGRTALRFAAAAICCIAGWLLATDASYGQDGEPSNNGLRFVDVTDAVGLNYRFRTTTRTRKHPFSAGVAAGDYDNDGWVDLLVVRGDAKPMLLFRNRGDGTFVRASRSAGLTVTSVPAVGATFADVDGDGWLDLAIGGAHPTPVRLFRNLAGAFSGMRSYSGVETTKNSLSAAFGDYDRDGDLDMALAHWDEDCGRCGREFVWRNDGSGRFEDDSQSAGITSRELEYSFTPSFADFNGDGAPDLAYAGDLGFSNVFLNRGDGRFVNATDRDVITDQHGMGTAIGDYDNDGDLDWFVTSIFDPPTGRNGNRLYRNDGAGRFEDVTDATGVRDGAWGWGACFVDLDNNGHLDLFHVNGWRLTHARDESRLFLADGDGGFTEQARRRGIVDPAQGRGVACFDYDQDGDVDLMTSNNGEMSRLYRNEGGNRNNFLAVRLRAPSPNVYAVGAWISIRVGDTRQLREISMGNHFVSQSPPEVHFGVGKAEVIDELSIRWPDGTVQTVQTIAANQFLEFHRDGSAPSGWVER